MSIYFHTVTAYNLLRRNGAANAISSATRDPVRLSR